VRSLKYGVAVALCISLLGCAASSQLSPMQFRQISTRPIEGSYENIFRATMTILQDNSYIIKQTDMEAGLIMSEVNREASGGSQFMQALFTGEVFDKGTVVEASAVVSKISETTSEVRITIQEKKYSSRGGTTSVKQLENAEIYKKLFDQIVVEVKRREAMGR
jgi:coproporphyrinogen III oxidase